MRGRDDIKFNSRAETFGVIHEALHEIGSLSTVDVCGPVFDFRGRHQLSALLHAGD